ncbi:MarR family transcriptional regulator [Bacillus sp. FJAT-27264]|uniref:MarR family winged helix-turn-helix transcriptional regulator n=1 Tax=Paenibacillus sp. (strain DSM 101736 / FJAT-27264) TaxID=1850362 RepID=UPI00080809FD|nr:MarR family transcriptional regulator [Bacillus sp. FJAT-27264]OBZ18847.1 MarR family transcriptional regulator [Bacillus sp. FJAT-27264]
MNNFDETEQSACSPKDEQDTHVIQRFPINFAIFSMARSHRGLAANLLREAGLFAGQEIMLMQLGEQDGQSQQCLGRTMRLDHSTVAKSVRRLEEAGLVTRSRSPKDGRVTLVKLTEVGRELVDKATAVWTEMEKAASQDLSEEERKLLISLSQKISANLDGFMI